MNTLQQLLEDYRKGGSFPSYTELAEISTQDNGSVINQTLLDALRALLQRDVMNTCTHEETYRGGVLWTICSDCGRKWADDEGGKPEWVDPPEWTAASEAIIEAEAADNVMPLLVSDVAREFGVGVPDVVKVLERAGHEHTSQGTCVTKLMMKSLYEYFNEGKYDRSIKHPAAWQERQEIAPGVFGYWYHCSDNRSLSDPREVNYSGIRYQFRPLYTEE